jgi:AcrR family transcriptional regulator
MSRPVKDPRAQKMRSAISEKGRALPVRGRILEAAAAAFAEEGFAGARVDEIARRAGVNKATLYYQVGEKAELYETVLLTVIDRAAAAVTQAVADAPTPEERLRRVIATMVDLADSEPHFPRLLLREVASGGVNLPDGVLEKMASVFLIVRGVLAEGEAQGFLRAHNPLFTHLLIVGSVVFLVASSPVRARMRRVLGAKLPPELPRSEMAEHVAEVLLHGLLAPPRKRWKK